MQTLKWVPIGTSRSVVIRKEKKQKIGRDPLSHNKLGNFPYKMVVQKQSDGAFVLSKNRSKIKIATLFHGDPDQFFSSLA